ncbi:hypothetical protein [Nonomuraea bangladeshensis]|uniref:hypothetical protein n=1 Tax=Nonomuraea bangladeshensis TaxID=404385 RepID=UPI003C2C753E
MTVHIYSGGHRTERARRRCLERLLIEIDQAGAAKVVIESRSPEQDQLDRGLLTGLRKATIVPKSLAVTWQPSIGEPLLWAADAVVSATTWWIDGVPTFYDLLSPKMSTICVD